MIDREDRDDAFKPPATFEDLKARITRDYEGYSRRLRQIADHAMTHPNDFAFHTAADVAKACGTAPSALIRFAQTLGYSGFSELQGVFQARLSDMAPSYRDRIRHLTAAETGGGAGPEALGALFTDAAIEALRHLRESLPHAALEQAATLMAGARITHLVASRRTFPAAFYLAYNLNRLEVPANLLDGVGGTMEQQLTLVGPEDVLVAISFQPSAPESRLAMDVALKRGARTVVITDAPRAPFNEADILFEVAEASVTDFRSLNVTMSLALILALRVGQLREGHAPDGTR
ncbi:MurR/RpiR family transcriptional regulator [Roseospira visakhapatnamensis]|uniref:DNA-binding MurR/RpiR family transcriptional regulator n=1 Tax=Roseospira visakhapatnamensis TaxID=390880 RepID=A0A7W6REP8_9PROT|nr:MurR/RpiR family transcriptional regulator [Roseospira visakhapatnamensis]MBB4267052.1 DNA-binding MurR/RpiR family transcriptional regulator [Roseospira visakhapatnamensis]